MIVLSVLLLLLDVSRAHSAPALPLHVTFSEDIDPNWRAQYPPILHSALMLVGSFPPPGRESNLLRWTGARDGLTGKTFRIVFSTSRSPEVAAVVNGDVPMDSATIGSVLKTSEGPITSISLHLIIDRIFLDSRGLEAKDGFVNLVVALAHEIFGPVQAFLEMDASAAKRQTRADTLRLQVEGQHMVLKFLLGLTNHAGIATLPANLVEGLQRASEREVTRYQVLRREKPVEGLDPTCEALLHQFLKSKE